MRPTSNESHERARAAGALALLSIIWGYNWVIMKLGVTYASPLAFAGWRFLIAAITFVPILKWMGYPIAIPRSEWRMVAILSVALAANFAGTFMALNFGGTGKVAFLVYTMPFWVVVFASIFLHERMGPTQWAAVALAACGLTVLADPTHLTGLLSSSLAIAAGLSWAASVVFIKNVQGKTKSHLLSMTLWQMLIGSLLLFTADALFPTRPTQWSLEMLSALAFTAIIASSLAWILFYYALARLPAGVAGLGTLATPVLGVLSAWLQFGERPSAQQALGMALIGVGLALLAIPNKKSERSVATSQGGKP